MPSDERLCVHGADSDNCTLSGRYSTETHLVTLPVKLWKTSPFEFRFKIQFIRQQTISVDGALKTRKDSAEINSGRYLHDQTEKILKKCPKSDYTDVFKISTNYSGLTAI